MQYIRYNQIAATVFAFLDSRRVRCMYDNSVTYVRLTYAVFQHILSIAFAVVLQCFACF